MFALDIAIVLAVKAAIATFIAETSIMGIPVGVYTVLGSGAMMITNVACKKLEEKTNSKKKNTEVISIPLNFKVGD